MADDPIAILAASRRDKPEKPDPLHLWPLILIALILLSVAIAFFGDKNQGDLTPGPKTSDTPLPVARVYVVSYRFGVFSPTNLRIHAGDTVRFRNDSPLSIRIIADLQPGARTPEFDSAGPVESGSYFSYTFPLAGTFGYHNDADLTEAGVIIVR